jgi:hypothetical protein
VRHENKIEKGNGRNLLKRSYESWRNINVFRREKIKGTGVCNKASQQVKDYSIGTVGNILVNKRKVSV